jgi:transposase
MGRSTEGRQRLSEQRKYRKVTAKQKLEIVLASLRGDRLEAAAERFESGQERSLQAEQRRRIRELERALGRKTYELEIAGEALRGWE